MRIGRVILWIVGLLLLVVASGTGLVAYQVYSPITFDNVAVRLNRVCRLIGLAERREEPNPRRRTVAELCACGVIVALEDRGAEATAKLVEAGRTEILLPELHAVLLRRNPPRSNENSAAKEIQAYEEAIRAKLEQRCPHEI